MDQQIELSDLRIETRSAGLATPFSGNSEPTDSVVNSTIHLNTTNESSLPPVDRGRGAWSFLLSAFVIEVLVWGFPNSFGIFLDAYRSDPTYTLQAKSTLLLPLIGPLSSGIMFCSGPIINAIMDRFPHHRRTYMWIGAVLCWASLFGASFTTNVPLLLMTQGVLYAIGGVLLYFPCFSYMSEWFVERRGFATGVMFAGTALGGVAWPLILPRMISSLGLQKTLRYASIGTISLLLPALPFAKGRIPQLRSRINAPAPRGANRKWLKSRTFWASIVVSTLQGFGHYIPMVWLPTYASSLQITPTKASITLALLNGASFISGVVLGYLSDRSSPWMLAVLNTFFTSLSTFILWGVLATSFGGLLAFGIVYGLLAGGFTSLLSSFIRPLARDDPRVATVILGYLGLSRGIGNIVSTPISSILLKSSYQVSNMTAGVPTTHHRQTGFDVGDGKYEKVIVYAGTCFAGAAVISVAGWVGDRRARARAAEGGDEQ